jgi:chromosome partitioning protein
MSKTIAVANKKGGAGKSTLAINLAAAAAAAQIATAIIDLDPDQQAASKWRDSRTADSPIVLSAVYSRLPQAVAEAEGRGAELILLDTPALVESIISAAIAVADIVLIPCRTTGQDIQYFTSTIDLVAARQKPAAVVLNSVESRLAETEQAMALIEKLGIAIAPYHLSKAVAYHRAITAGLGVTELDSTGKAAQEILNLLAWISRLLYLSTGGEVEPSQPRSVAK